MKTNVFYKPPNKFRFEEFNTLSYSFEDSPNCLLTTETGPGPFFIPESIYRIDITEGQTGIGLFIGLKIVNASNCSNLHRAKVEIWQANAEGEYSGFSLLEEGETPPLKPTNQERWLRGWQESDHLGFVEFKTIYPGKYLNRTNHIHLRISYQDQVLLTTQVFFPQNINDFVSTISPYDQNPRFVTNYNDPVIQRYNGCRGCWPKVSGFGTRYIATLTIGVNLQGR
ncbi:MAG TPA: protocatechuate dioxygenase [Acholeplasmataceae bacterium]|nr:protocatechuate dioxygenase [Acholeplasmataceae bacterium]